MKWEWFEVPSRFGNFTSFWLDTLLRDDQVEIPGDEGSMEWWLSDVNLQRFFFWEINFDGYDNAIES